jgi:hypothetical protein
MKKITIRINNALETGNGVDRRARKLCFMGGKTNCVYDTPLSQQILPTERLTLWVELRW